MFAKLPDSSGVYLFKDANKKIIYVGKALSIRKRVRDHFNLKNSSYKERKMTEKTAKVDAIQVDSEIEALILEANLIKKYKPFFNNQLKDDKDYIYIKITKDEFPRVLAARKRDLIDTADYFGPFPSASKVRTTLKTLRRIFPFSTCKPQKAGRVENKKRPCLAYHLGLCPGVCAGKIDKKDYRANVRSLRLFLCGKKLEVLKKMEKRIALASKKLEFEEAATFQKKLEALNYIIRPARKPYIYLEQDIESIRAKEMGDISVILNLKQQPKRIECYDISNIFGRQAVGSMVVFSKGNPDKDEYRRFRIKRVSGINDTAMLSEVLERRFSNPWPKPDLLVMDGGRPQLNTAVKTLKKLGINIPVISLAKRYEEIYIDGRQKPLRLPARNDALKLVQRLRDEAHRFAITYHRKLRKREFLTTA